MRKLQLAVIFLSLTFMAGAIVNQWDNIAALEWSFRADLLALSLLSIVGVFLLDAYGWHLILRSLGLEPAPLVSLQIWLLSSLARYIPGVAWSYASRISLAKAKGIGASRTSISLYLETLLLITSSAAVGLPALLATANQPIGLMSMVLLWVCLGLLLHPRMISLLRFLPGRLGKVFADLHLPRPKVMLAVYLYYVLFWTLFGAAFVCFILAFYPLPPDEWLPAGASIAMGFLAGFLLVVFPGGIGVRESALYILLSPFLPTPANLLVSIGSRAWVMFGEVASIGLVLLLQPDSNRNDRGTTPQ